MKLQIRGETWRRDLERHEIIYVDDLDIIKSLVFSEDVLVCSRCSKAKTEVDEAVIPKYLYVSNQNLQFYGWCEKYHVEYGILSDLYGLVLWNEKVNQYDVHPSSVTDEQFIDLSKKIKRKMNQHKWSKFLYWNSSPVMSVPYFKMMKLTGLQIFYMTKLPVFVNYGFGLSRN